MKIPRRGNVCGRRPPEFGKASLGMMGALHGFQTWQMFEARIILESDIAALAAERGKDEHYTALAEEVAEMFAAMDSPADFLIHDLLFSPHHLEGFRQSHSCRSD